MAIAYTETPTGVGIIADLAHVPEDTANKDWLTKLEIEQSTGIDPAPPLYLDIAVAIVEAVKYVNAAAKALRDEELPAGPGSDALFYLRHQEAIACDAEARRRRRSTRSSSPRCRRRRRRSSSWPTR